MLEIIGITGYAGSGKDELYLQRFQPEGYIRLAFADELKKEISHAFNVSVEEINNNKKLWRKLMVVWGETKRAIDPEYWIKKVFAQMKPNKKYCITDMRYHNEGVAIQQIGGLLIRMSKPGCIANNPTEYNSIERLKLLDGIHIIYNIRSKEHLQTVLKGI